MASRSLNKVILIGNLTRDPELRYTPQGTAVCTFGVATNRYWVTENGEKREETEFHRIVSWNKLAELCSQLLTKGRKVYVEGRLQTRSWTGQDGNQRTTTEIVIEDMIILDSRRSMEAPVEAGTMPAVPLAPASPPSIVPSALPAVPSAATDVASMTKPAVDEDKKRKKGKDKDEQKEEPKEEEKTAQPPTEDISPEDIPF